MLGDHAYQVGQGVAARRLTAPAADQAVERPPAAAGGLAGWSAVPSRSAAGEPAAFGSARGQGAFCVLSAGLGGNSGPAGSGPSSSIQVRPGLAGEDPHDHLAQDGPAAEPAAAGRRRLGGHRLRPARPPRDRLRQGIRQAQLSLRRVRLLLLGRHPAVALRGPRGDRVPARAGVRDALPARGAGRGHDRQRRAHAGDIGRARARLNPHDPGLLPALRHRTAAMLRAGRRRRPRPGRGG